MMVPRLVAIPHSRELSVKITRQTMKKQKS
jgi:hypothetical protein